MQIFLLADLRSHHKIFLLSPRNELETPNEMVVSPLAKKIIQCRNFTFHRSLLLLFPIFSFTSDKTSLKSHVTVQITRVTENLRKDKKMSVFRGIPLLGQKAAIQLDLDLMVSPGFSIDQLMELAGISIASAIHDAYPEAKKVLAIAGPGNNGGDAFVAVRHLKHFGYEPTIVYPKENKKQLYQNLQAQIRNLNIDIIPELPKNFDTSFDLILDGVFGFSFNSSNGIRAPFDSIVKELVSAKTPMVSIDIPSGWHVEKGPEGLQQFLEPETLISLSVPKIGTRYFKGKHHYLGGRFVPPHIIEKYSLSKLPAYQGSLQFVKLNWTEPQDNCL